MFNIKFDWTIYAFYNSLSSMIWNLFCKGAQDFLPDFEQTSALNTSCYPVPRYKPLSSALKKTEEWLGNARVCRSCMNITCNDRIASTDAAYTKWKLKPTVNVSVISVCIIKLLEVDQWHAKDYLENWKLMIDAWLLLNSEHLSPIHVYATWIKT